VTSRTYLSIGDVLTLLREEFPDVTISKIRFLESQGLVNPERSPSGYRKFFEHDVERLRWVLRQQREHFLPLKVIRDRLADGDLDDAPQRGANGKPSEADGSTSHTASSVGAAADEQPTKADEEAMARILADASRRAALMPEAAQVRRGLQVVGEAPAPEGAPAADVSARDKGTQIAAGESGQEEAVSARAADASAPTQSDDAGARAGKARTPAPAAPPAAAARPSASKSTGGPAATAAATSGLATGASLTAQEVCAASGLSTEELEGLESYGLIGSMRVAGLQTYDEEALAVANLAAAFRGYGIEPRHLRLYRNAVDREMGLIEQVIIPLLRQRNPESRQRAVEGADQLAALGQSMRASLLRQALRQHLGG
jgi:DNA-binding transcriptional MerR regulator